MDLSDFVEDGQPITYEKAYNYFARDPAQKQVNSCIFILSLLISCYQFVNMKHPCRWAAYVAGTILVLMTELGIRFEDSISILVSLSGVHSFCKFLF